MEPIQSSSSTVSTVVDPDVSDTCVIKPPSQFQHEVIENEVPPWHQVVLPAVSFTGVQLAWAVVTGHATAHLRKLGLPDSEVGLAWLAGPVSGTLVQPVVGALSDRCTSQFGRRRPFIVVGSVGVLLGFLTFAFAEQLVGSHGGSALALAIASFWLADAAINVMQTPTRALLADLADGEHLTFGSSLFGVASGIGKCVGFALGAFLPSVEMTFAAAGGIVVAFALITVVFSRELPANTKVENGVFRALRDALGKMVRILEYPPAGLRETFCVQWLTYYSIMLVLIYGADWVGKDVFGGDGDAPPGSKGRAVFEEGVRFANAAFLLMAVVSIVVSVLLPRLRKTFTTRGVWAACLIPMATALLCSPLPVGRKGVLLIFGALAGAAAAAFSLPWEIVSRLLVDDLANDKALCLAVFNLAQATPGVIASITGGLIIRLGNGNIGSVLFAAGCVMVTALAALLIVDIPSCDNVDAKGVNVPNIKCGVTLAANKGDRADVTQTTV